MILVASKCRRCVPSIAAVTVALAVLAAPSMAPAQKSGVAVPPMLKPFGQDLIAQNEKPKPKSPLHYSYGNPCPPGSQIEFVFRNTSLLMDPNWIGIASMSEVNAQTDGKCPEGKVKLYEITIYQPRPPAVRRFFVSRGLPNFIQIRAPHGGDPQRSEVYTTPSTRRHLPDGGYIEDVTDKYARNVLRKDLIRTTRNYRLELPATPTDPEPMPFIVSCTGNPNEHPGRWCSTASFRYGSDIVMGYRFRQNRHDIASERWPTPDGSISEPDGFLAMAGRLREWLDEIRKD